MPLPPWPRHLCHEDADGEMPGFDAFIWPGKRQDLSDMLYRIEQGKSK
jgi:hypothetical protein